MTSSKKGVGIWYVMHTYTLYLQLALAHVLKFTMDLFISCTFEQIIRSSVVLKAEQTTCIYEKINLGYLLLLASLCGNKISKDNSMLERERDARQRETELNCELREARLARRRRHRTRQAQMYANRTTKQFKKGNRDF